MTISNVIIIFILALGVLVLLNSNKTKAPDETKRKKLESDIEDLESKLKETHKLDDPKRIEDYWNKK